MTHSNVRPVELRDAAAWSRLRSVLWPESPQDHPPEITAFLENPPDDATCLVVEAPDGEIVGFAEVGLRPYAEECVSSPVGYLEGIYVVPEHREAGLGRRLVEAGEVWARGRGCTELASDRAIDNEASGAFHEAVGFQEAGRIVCYRKALRP